MELKKAKAEVFKMNFKGLVKKKGQSVEKMLKDKELMEELIDTAIIKQPHDEPSRPSENYLAERKCKMLNIDINSSVLLFRNSTIP